MAEEVPWTKLKQDSVLKAIDVVRDTLASGKHRGPDAGLAEFMSQVKKADDLMELVVGLNELAAMLVERIESEHRVRTFDTLLDVSQDVRNKKLIGE